mmetsp:Transcript_90839/g.265932  ORF Transcript_90839/g.265932 Transcript_90839/m.265932 type:complete len:253 (-) Transcript_90839:18-776(-)
MNSNTHGLPNLAPRRCASSSNALYLLLFPLADGKVHACFCSRLNFLPFHPLAEFCQKHLASAVGVHFGKRFVARTLKSNVRCPRLTRLCHLLQAGCPLLVRDAPIIRSRGALGVTIHQGEDLKPSHVVVQAADEQAEFLEGDIVARVHTCNVLDRGSILCVIEGADVRMAVPPPDNFALIAPQLPLQCGLDAGIHLSQREVAVGVGVPAPPQLLPRRAQLAGAALEAAQELVDGRSHGDGAQRGARGQTLET